MFIAPRDAYNEKLTHCSEPPRTNTNASLQLGSMLKHKILDQTLEMTITEKKNMQQQKIERVLRRTVRKGCRRLANTFFTGDVPSDSDPSSNKMFVRRRPSDRTYHVLQRLQKKLALF